MKKNKVFFIKTFNDYSFQFDRKDTHTFFYLSIFRLNLQSTCRSLNIGDTLDIGRIKYRLINQQISKKDLDGYWWYIVTMAQNHRLFFLCSSHFSISRQANSTERGKLTSCIGFFFFLEKIIDWSEFFTLFLTFHWIAFIFFLNYFLIKRMTDVIRSTALFTTHHIMTSARAMINLEKSGWKHFYFFWIKKFLL